MSYHYELPEELLARTPAEPRDGARLLLVDTKSGELGEDIFRNVAERLAPGSLLVVNDTKVVPARVISKKESGGKVELLFLVNEWDRIGPVPAISDRKLVVGQRIFLDEAHVCIVVEQQENVFFFKLEFPTDELVPLLAQIGETPLPRYISKAPLDEKWLRERYQSVVAEKPASVAAPTALLHFTHQVFQSLQEKGVEIAHVTLHVGLGTFAPVTERELSAGKLHEERYEIPTATAEAICKAKAEGRPVVAVGTTVVRTLESAVQQLSNFHDGRHENLTGETRLFIRPSHDFKIVDQLITNFHLPESSLMYLVDAFLQYKKSPKSILDIYQEAIHRRFRFYSFGDAMFVQ